MKYDVKRVGFYRDTFICTIDDLEEAIAKAKELKKGNSSEYYAITLKEDERHIYEE